MNPLSQLFDAIKKLSRKPTDLHHMTRLFPYIINDVEAIKYLQRSRLYSIGLANTNVLIASIDDAGLDATTRHPQGGHEAKSRHRQQETRMGSELQMLLTLQGLLQ